jgi:septal ring factor EnvC (AmiA/AmiB activator)
VTPSTGTFPPQSGAAHASHALSPPKTPFSGVNFSAPMLQSTQSDSQIVTFSSLQSSLEEERTLRLRAESNLSQTQTELEELTAQLFGQANEMVATERKARAQLEERVKVLEQRDVDKRKRLDRLEKAILRIERVRGMVGS